MEAVGVFVIGWLALGALTVGALNAAKVLVRSSARFSATPSVERAVADPPVGAVDPPSPMLSSSP